MNRVKTKFPLYQIYNFQKADQDTEGMWLMHNTKHQKDNAKPGTAL